jgi:hypothetical protein
VNIGLIAACVPGAPVPDKGVEYEKDPPGSVHEPAPFPNVPALVPVEAVLTFDPDTSHESAVEFAVVLGFRLITASHDSDTVLMVLPELFCRTTP